MKRLTGPQRVALGLVAGVLALNVMAIAIEAFVPSPSGPGSSSYATSAGGAAAYGSLLERDREVVRVRESLGRAALDESGTVVVLEPDLLVPDEINILKRFVREGGRLVAGGLRQEYLQGLLGDGAPVSQAAAPRRWSAAAEPSGGGSRTVTSAGRGSFSQTGSTKPVVGEKDRALVVKARLGRGEVALLADASPLQNRLLSRSDNAALGLGVAGERSGPVQFIEAVHGYGDGRGLGALPRDWKLALIGLAVAALLLVASRARRLGPPDPPAPAAPPARAAYVSALGDTLRRTNDPEAATAVLRGGARELLAERLGPAAVVDSEALRASAERLGASPEEAAALAGEGAGEGALLAAGRGLGHIAQRTPAGGRPN